MGKKFPDYGRINGTSGFVSYLSFEFSTINIFIHRLKKFQKSIYIRHNSERVNGAYLWEVGGKGKVISIPIEISK